MIQEPGPAAGGRGGEGVSGAGGRTSRGPGADFRRALQGGWPPAGSVGEREDLSAQEGEESTTGRSWQSDRELSRREALESDATNPRPIRMRSWRAKARVRRPS
jgi:hypothetical protein